MTMFAARSRRLAAVVGAALTAVVAAAGLAACSSGEDQKTIKLVAYSVPKPAYDALGAAFAKTSAGKNTTVKGSYGPSGSQSKAVLGGQKADYVAFSVEPDLTKLVPSKVDAGWNSGPTKGLVSDSVVAIVVRKGNPKHITGWADLIKPGVKIVTPDPASSGSAKWNILAAYSHVLSQGGTEADAKTYLTNFFKHVVSRASSGAVATTQFTSGTGDALISYENEAISTRAKGAAIDYVVPDQSFLIENPAAVTKNAPKVAKQFLSFVESEQGQEIFASHGFRPVLPGAKIGTVKGANDPSNPFPKVKQLTTIADLGGWKVVNDKFFGDNGIVTKIEAST
ncbi:MAG TPA: sulfate ABC transporter substrate-binding protein [Jatrophihabitans sp.]|nr:sulfate ABC transporter substrate-binding protein [Jatrophihabitans sp.]